MKTFALIKILIIFSLLGFSNELLAQQTYRDNFSSTSYSNNDGTNNFSADWDEDNDGDSPSGGNIRITGNQLRFDELDSDDRISRTLNLAGASSVTLSLYYDATSRGNEGLDVELWNNSSSSWQTIAVIDNSNTGTISYTLSANQISANSAIRFVSNSNGWGNNERIYIDNVLFTATFAATILVNDVSVNEGAGTATFTVTHTGANTVGAFTVNYTTVNGTATAGSDYTTTSNILTFTGTSGVTRTITVPIIDDSLSENTETFTIQFTAKSNPSVNITDTGIGSIIDNDTFIISNGSSSTCSGDFLDSGGTSSYSNNENYTYTICPSTANTDLNINFSSFDVESGYDFLYIYDGSSTSATLLGQYHNGNPPPTSITATNTAGCLTFRFTSDGSVTNTGWAAQISCAPRGPKITVEDVVVNEGGGSITFTATHSGTNASGAFTVNYTTVNGTAIAGSDYTATSGTLNFNGITGQTRTFTVPILNDTNLESSETFTVQFISSSNASVNYTDSAIGTIIDNDGVIMTNGTTSNQCGTVFLDPGGLNDYGNNLNVTHTLCPQSGTDYVEVNFTSFDVESFDTLYVYQGTNTSGTLIGQYNNSNVPTTLTSTHASGCLTFRFVSNNSSNGSGWQANINCFVEGPRIVITDISFDEDIGNAIFTVTSTRAAHGTTLPLFGFINVPFTVNYTTLNGTALAGSDYTTTTGSLTFSGAIGNQRTISVPIANDGIPESAEDFTIMFTSANASYGTVNYNDTGTGTINSQILANVPLTLVKQFDGDFDYVTTGGTLRTLPNGSGGGSNPCAIQAVSSNTLISGIPGTGIIEAAYLYWAHSSYVRDEQVTFEGQQVNASAVYQTTFNASGTNLSFFGYVSDVTSLVKGIANINTNVFDFSGLTVDTSNNFCSTSTVLGGWTLMVFYEDPNLPAVNINLYQGFDGLQNNSTSFTLDSFYAIAGAGAKATFLSWEGDPDLASGGANPERLSITNQSNVTTILSGDGGQTGNNAYNSTIYDNTVTGPAYNTSNIYGVDLDTYDISAFITPGDSQVTANVNVGQDYVINNLVVIKVPSNLIAGTVFEDINYPGGNGRNQLAASGVGVSGAVVELFRSNGTFVERKNTDINGNYSFGGMQDGNYIVKVVNSTVHSTRGGGLNCGECFAIQTFRSFGNATTITEVTNQIGGAYPSAIQDAALGILVNAQSVSNVAVASNGVTGIDFGFNFNTIVNTNDSGQGSLEQFILNSNNLNEVGLDIGANSIFNPSAGSDTSIFMIPPTSDPLGRTADANYASGYFDILIPNNKQLSIITGTNTQIDGRTQTAYSGNTNSGTSGLGGTLVGTSLVALPNYDLPEIQIHRNTGDVIRSQGTNDVIRNISVFAGNNAGIQVLGGSSTISNSLIGVNALGVNAGNINFGIEITSGTAIIDGNFIATNQDNGVLINGGTSTLIQNNHITANGNAACDDNIRLQSGSGIVINHNLITNAAALGIDGDGITGSVIITENSITSSGQNGGNCSGSVENAGIKLDGNNSSITNNIIYANGGAGIVLAGGNTSGNLISQNSIYGNGTVSPALGIDIDKTDKQGDGVTLNDNGDGDNGPNGVLNFPIISGAFVAGTNLIVEGWSRPGATIEIFLTDINQGSAVTGANQLGMSTDYGEGQVYLATFIEGSGSDSASGAAVYTDVDGNNDNTNKFKFTVPLPLGVIKGNLITSTATIANSTSEFSPFSIITGYNVITNRRITYRVKPN